MFNFENLHSSHKLAFLDGALCGIVVSVIAVGFYKSYKEMRDEKRMMEEDDKNETAIN